MTTLALNVYNDIDADICNCEDDIHSKMESNKVNQVINNLGINRYSFFKASKKFDRQDIENFNIILETAYRTEKMKMFEIFLVLCKEFVEVPKAAKILTQTNMSIIKSELMARHRIKGPPNNTLLSFFC